MSRKRKHEARKRKYRLLKKMIDIGFFLLAVLIITFVLNTYVVERCKVRNHSMEPTLLEGDVIFIDKITYLKRSPKRYEIITFSNANNKDDLIKRIYGLPGETVRIVQGNIYIDGNKIVDLEGLDVPANPGIAENDIKLSDDEYFVIGDNRAVSIDSRDPSVGVIRSEDIIGKTLFRIKPLSKFIIR